MAPPSACPGRGRPRRRAALLGAALLGALAAACGTPGWRMPVPAPPRLDAASVGRDVAWLAADERDGRGLGTPGLAASADYIARAFAAAGLRPGAPDGTFFQRFEMPVSVRVETASLRLDGRPLQRGRDYEAFVSSASGKLTSDVVFAGYGISDERLGWDDYAGVEVAGKVVLVLDYRPELAGFSTGRVAPLLSRAYKLQNARDHGAAAVLLAPSAREVVGLAAGAGSELANPMSQEVGLLALGLSRDAADRLVRARGGAGLAARQSAIEARGAPGSGSLGVEAALEVAVARKRGEVMNVIGVRPGADARVNREAVVIGAHYDHLGHGEFGTLAPDRRGEIYNGADDNASGVAGLLALARLFGHAPPPRRSLVLAAFTGEEAGLAGSTRYAQKPSVPLSDTVAMLNLDMIGHLRTGGLSVFGVETSPAWPGLLERAARGLDLQPELVEGAAGPSDQTAFAIRHVPVAFFFTGLDDTYHTPDDDTAGVDVAGTARVLQMVYRTAWALLDAGGRPAASPASERAAGGPAWGYGAYLGTIPALGGPPGPGVRIQGVRPRSPAELAGLRSGDVIVEFDGGRVTTLEELAVRLLRARPGQTVDIVAERNGLRRHLTTTLGHRQ